jgi:hypothetical protein
MKEDRAMRLAAVQIQRDARRGDVRVNQRDQKIEENGRVPEGSACIQPLDHRATPAPYT